MKYPLVYTRQWIKNKIHNHDCDSIVTQIYLRLIWVILVRWIISNRLSGNNLFRKLSEIGYSFK